MIDPRKIWSSAQLPTLPSVAVALLDLSRDPETDVVEFVRVIRTDPAISAKILKAANSSFFAMRVQVTSLDRAVPLLGTTVVTSLALSFSLIDAAMPTGPMGENYQAYWRQSLVQAVAAERLAAISPLGNDCEFFLTGLLVDLGRLALLKTIPREYAAVLDGAQHLDGELHVVEKDLLGFDHVDIGSKLMENYQLPEPLLQAVRLHHAPVAELTARPTDQNSALVNATALAAAIGDYFCRPFKASPWKRVRALASQFYQIEGQPLQQLLDDVRSRVSLAGQLFSVDTDEIRTPGELMAEANEQLAQLAVREHIATTQAVARNQAVEREKQALETRARSLELQAMHDPLTQIYNRRYFDEAYQREICRCGRSADPVAVIFTDIDRFKQLNDTYGHAAGDQALTQVAAALGEMLRKSDILARYGGEEFVILVSQPTEKGLEKVAERLRERIAREPVMLDGQRVPVTVSVGAALAIPRRTDRDLAERLLAAADEAMYESKRNGRNQVTYRFLGDERDRRIIQLSVQKRFSRWLARQGVLEIPDLSKVLLELETAHVRLGVIAQKQAYLDADRVDTILQDQDAHGERFGVTALRLALLDEEQVAQLLALQQEDPLALGNLLVRKEMLPRDQATELLKAFLSETLSARPAAEASSLF